MQQNVSKYMLENKNRVIHKLARKQIRRLFFRRYVRYIKHEVRDLYIYMKQRQTQFKDKKISYDKWDRPLFKLTRVHFERWQDIKHVLLKPIHRQSYTAHKVSSPLKKRVSFDENSHVQHGVRDTVKDIKITNP